MIKKLSISVLCAVVYFFPLTSDAFTINAIQRIMANNHPVNYSNNFFIQSGKASWYGNEFRGRKTSSGVIFNPEHYTAAHNTLPLGSVLEVTNLNNNRNVIVVITDRGPSMKHVRQNNRIIDLSKKAAETLGFKNNGIANVRIKYLFKTNIAEVAQG